ncbi:MAG: sialidase family protein [Actinomycetaceae bacterium]|nr:sialidase family protein [Actinomycetaceae bacterium]MDU0970723.1 sialidase family protein [Actinomycetaceae bacterium]
MTTLPLDQAAHLTSGTLVFRFRVLADATLLSAAGERGQIALVSERDRLSVRVESPERSAFIELEDAVPVTDGEWHAFALTVDDTATRVFVDGGLEMTSTATVFLGTIGASAIEIADDTVATITDLAVHADVWSPREVMAAASLPEPVAEFGANYLAAEDARALAGLTSGTTALRFRTRGVGQAGTILAAGCGDEDAIRVSVTADSLIYAAKVAGAWRQWTASGQWACGDWHDVAIRCGAGVTDIYVDGSRALHAPGFAFFGAAGAIERAVIGQDLRGDRLFGEVQTAAIYAQRLTEGGILKAAHRVSDDVIPVFDRGMEGAVSYRIPSLIALPSGRLVAGADQRIVIPNDAPNEIHFVVRTSDDGGDTWSDMRTVAAFPGGGRDGASLIDSCLVYDAQRGRLDVIIDHFPGGIGQFNSVPGTGFATDGRMELRDAQGRTHLWDRATGVVEADGEPTPYRVEADGSVTYDGQPCGRIFDKATGQTPGLTMVPTSYLMHFYSDDEGDTWSTPRHLNPALKLDWMTFLGTGPGIGCQLTRGAHAGRLVAPYYASEATGKFFSAGVLYSDDGGETWLRGATAIERDGSGVERLEHLADKELSTYEATVVECSDGRLLILMRNQHPSGRVACAYSADGGQTWGETHYHEDLPEIFSQPNAIRLPLADGSQALAFANATQLLPFRGEGVLRVSCDDGRTWPGRKTIKSGHYVYQCMAPLRDGTIAILWENEWQGLYLSRVSVPATGLVARGR